MLAEGVTRGSGESNKIEKRRQAESAVNPTPNKSICSEYHDDVHDAHSNPLDTEDGRDKAKPANKLTDNPTGGSDKYSGGVGW